MSEPQLTPKDAIGRAKPGISCIPPGPLFKAGKVMQSGAAKYGPFNWRADSIAASVYYDAAFRHLAAWFDGEDIDPESGIEHLAHVIGCCVIALDAVECGRFHDDRPRSGNAAEIIKRLTRIEAG